MFLNFDSFDLNNYTNEIIHLSFQFLNLKKYLHEIKLTLL